MNKDAISEIHTLLNKPDCKISIITHVNPDGDAIGSSLGLYLFLKKLGLKNVEVLTPNAFPEFLAWMPQSRKIINASAHHNQAKKLLHDSDVLFCLDFNDTQRTDQLEDLINHCKAKKVLIDHHPNPTKGFDYYFSTTETSSTAEMVFSFIQLLGEEKLFDENIGACLYAGIITDTGSFSYACNNAHTYEVVAKIISLGVDGEHIHKLIYNTYSESRMRLLGYCLSDKLKLVGACQVAYISLDEDELKRFNYKDGDTEGVVNYALSIKGIEVAAILIERAEVVKISLRSRGKLDVNKIARSYFEGGGHQNAAGGKLKKPYNEAISKFENIIQDLCENEFKDFHQ